MRGLFASLICGGPIRFRWHYTANEDPFLGFKVKETLNSIVIYSMLSSIILSDHNSKWSVSGQEQDNAGGIGLAVIRPPL